MLYTEHTPVLNPPTPTPTRNRPFCNAFICKVAFSRPSVHRPTHWTAEMASRPLAWVDEIENWI